MEAITNLNKKSKQKHKLSTVNGEEVTDPCVISDNFGKSFIQFLLNRK